MSERYPHLVNHLRYYAEEVESICQSAANEIERLREGRLQVCPHLFISGSGEGINKIYCGSCQKEYMVPSKAFFNKAALEGE